MERYWVSDMKIFSSRSTPAKFFYYLQHKQKRKNFYLLSGHKRGCAPVTRFFLFPLYFFSGFLLHADKCFQILAYVSSEKILFVQGIFSNVSPSLDLALVWEESTTSGELKTPVKLVHPYSVQYFSYNFQQREVKFPKSHRKAFSPVYSLSLNTWFTGSK